MGFYPVVQNKVAFTLSKSNSEHQVENAYMCSLQSSGWNVEDLPCKTLVHE